jgi:hypothetical protein
MIALYLAVTFGSEKDFEYLLERDPAAWKPAFHRVDKYWKRLSQSPIFQGHSWESVRDQTIFLLGEVDKMCVNEILHLNKYKATPHHDFTYEQNMLLIEKALKLGTLTPFTMKPTDDMAEMLSESPVFGQYIRSEDLVMLCLQANELISYLVRTFYVLKLLYKLTQYGETLVISRRAR